MELQLKLGTHLHNKMPFNLKKISDAHISLFQQAFFTYLHSKFQHKSEIQYI